jgi:hypothetical protein
MIIFVSPDSILSNWLYFESGFAYSKGKRHDDCAPQITELSMEQEKGQFTSNPTIRRRPSRVRPSSFSVLPFFSSMLNLVSVIAIMSRLLSSDL